MSQKTLLYNIGKLYTPIEVSRGEEMNNLLILNDAFILIEEGVITKVEAGDYNAHVDENTILHDCEQHIAIPGLIDSHTHLVHGGSRENEFDMKLAGVPYLDILKQGGGILSTVTSTREATVEALYEKAKSSLNEMLAFGVTTVESKSGYGLNLETEIKQLKVNKQLNKNHPVDIVSTYLGAHAIPTEFKGNKSGYIETLLTDMETIKKEQLATFIDVFCEDSVFNKEDSRKILSHGKEIGLKVKIHADEIVSLGGAALATELEASSADHLMAISDEDIEKIANSNVVANLLPCTSFYLNKDYAPARKLIDSGAIVSISSDYNPGSTPSENFQFAMQLAANKLRMTPKEVLTASTINAAYNLGLNDKVGSITVGKQADITIMKAPNLEYTMYHYGINHTKDVFKNGNLVVKNRNVL